MTNTTQITEVIHIEHMGEIALICIDNPPVNAVNHAARVGLQNAVEQLNADTAVKVIAIYGAGRTFIAGADIREFGKPSAAPILPAVCTTLENSDKPVISVLHGTTLGGGLELALSTHARIAIEGLKVGLPEVLLGILPGAGGTQRLPRLIGIPAALEMITTGRHIPATEALALGLVDRITTGDPREAAITATNDVLTGTLKTRRTGLLATKPDDTALTQMSDKLRAKGHLFSPLKCVGAIAASTGDLTEGLMLERQLFTECLHSPQSAGLIHAFFSERAVAKIPEAKATPREIATIGVIGGGTMGSGIATSALLAGLSVVLAEVADEALQRGIATIIKNLDGAVKRGKLRAEKYDATLAALSASTDMGGLADADIVIEAAYEDMAVKKEIFAKLDTICKQGAVLATNTSYLDINEIASATNRPEDVIGLHFFSPAHVMRLLEVVVADKTAPEVIATGFALAKRLRKIAVRAGVCDGFIGNRILAHYKMVADYIVMDGASPQDVDEALEGFGFAMGPFKVGDLAGLDIGWATRKRKAPTRSPDERYIPISDRICENGWFGRKTGQGYYVYDGKFSTPNPEVAKIIDTERLKADITVQTFAQDEIVDRYMTAMISEAARVLEDGIALRPIDVDAVFLFGYGFPRHRGGPLHYADTIGATELVRRIKAYANDDPHYWNPPTLLEKMVADGSTFADMNKEA
ncbi:MAG: 3-hydroxyacyl-CoA dehydrogenase NAD-binding domain-containing protein [Paracoccaceae bacterium]